LDGLIADEPTLISDDTVPVLASKYRIGMTPLTLLFSALGSTKECQSTALISDETLPHGCVALSERTCHVITSLLRTLRQCTV
jgi:hypothetical protein